MYRLGSLTQRSGFRWPRPVIDEAGRLVAYVDEEWGPAIVGALTQADLRRYERRGALEWVER